MCWPFCSDVPHGSARPISTNECCTKPTNRKRKRCSVGTRLPLLELGWREWKKTAENGRRSKFVTSLLRDRRNAKRYAALPVRTSGYCTHGYIAAVGWLVSASYPPAVYLNG